MKNLLLLFVLFGVGYLGVAQTAENKEDQLVSAEVAEVTWEADVHDFGVIKKDVPASYEFKFKNTGTTALIITSVKASCGCTATNYPKNPVSPGETASVTATYNAKVQGSFSKTLTVYTNADNPVKVLRIKGTVE